MYYGRDRLPAPDETATGGVVKFQRLSRAFPNSPHRFNLVYLGSNTLPGDWPRLLGAADWNDWLVRPEDRDFVMAFRSATSRGRTLASDSFVSKLEARINLRLRPLPVGRPRKSEERRE